jgi:DDE superfamily endonuclease
MGPQASRSYPGRRLVKPAGPRAERAEQEIDYGRRDVAGHVFGALQPATGAAFTATYAGRTTANWIDFLGQVEAWIGPTAERVYAVVDNLNTHGGTDVLLFALAHPRWEFVFQPKYAAYLNLVRGTAADAIGSSRGGRCCVRSLSRAAASRPGRRSSRPSCAPPPTGTHTSIPSSGAAGGATACPGAPASPPRQTSHAFSGCTT